MKDVMKIIITLLCVSYSQVVQANLRNDTICYQYAISGSVKSVKKITMTNTSSTTIWLWFQKDSTVFDNYKALRDYFFTRNNNPNSWPLYRIITDPNRNKLICSLPYCFIKRILPNQLFTVFIISEEDNKSDFYQILSIDEDCLSPLLKSLDFFEAPFFQPDEIILNSRIIVK